jgi:DNA-binding CsgD family transcriptional regulator
MTPRGPSYWRNLAPERFSDIIGAIYDSAIQPELWPKTIGAIAAAANCFAGMIGVTDLDHEVATPLYSWGYEPGCVDFMTSFVKEVIAVYRGIPDLKSYYDVPLSARRASSPEILENSPYVRGLQSKYGIVDSVDLFLIAEPHRIAELGLSRHESAGYVTDRDLEVVRLLAPHIRRAVTIGDLLDMKTLETAALASALDGFAVGVVIVGAEGRILHANEPARGMLARGTPILSSNGRLATLQPKTTGELQQAISIAQANEASIGKVGIGVPLLNQNMSVATAHVLPLARGDRRTRLLPQAMAAVFVLPVDAPAPADLGTIARIFELTPAEGRLMKELAAGKSITDAAACLGVAEPTAKTHRAHIFSKMGIKRRTELMALIARLIPPLTLSR